MATENLLPVVQSPAAAQVPAHLVESTHRYVESGLRGAPNTVRAYAGDWKRFTTWCALHQLAALPASVEALVGFLTELADAGKKYATIERHGAAIAKAHELAGVESPTADKKLKVLLRGIAREIKTRQKQAPAFSLDSFKRTIKSIDVTVPAGLRNRALLLLGFTGAFRRSELEALNIEDLAFDEDGLVVTLPHSKTNQLGQAEEKAIFYSPDSALCPIRSLQAWLRMLGRTEGPVFVSMRRNNQVTTRRMTTKYTNLIVQQYLGPQYTAHSLRASFVTVSKLNGADDSKVMNQTKHKTSAMIRRYTRLDNVRQHNSAKELGL
ncbi:Site-specific recombinase XerD [Hymenobacter gelipurpurascens]|uniref:Site-specific recombinase XerD n=1 Tax=Hymenobacter gelipurpurascens TaxID=89968 RepID=A0A212UHS6_9BACT|nr:tyrosine-type recombinase/integrase [Hymenobacter gelipurpurascens]SNC77614.1 Site-specific recombinase XerD [Hymenobacter gelipurpurascens]SNC77646.1 Site-specific recombinase XerD [Hymenobacter gelipurpurascens]